MALPLLEKTWEHEVNYLTTHTAGSTEDKDRDAMLWLKNSLKTSFTAGWTVEGSSNSTAYSMDGTDRWSSVSDLVWNNVGSAHSWIVLNAPVGSCQICIDLRTGVTRTATIAFSPEGLYTGGSILERPTAVDETCTSTNEWFDGVYWEPYEAFAHLLQSTDGEVCLFIVPRLGAMHGGFIFFKAGNPEPDWDAPYGFMRFDSQDGSPQVWMYSSWRNGSYYESGAKEAYTADAGNTFSFDFAVEGNINQAASMEAIGELVPGPNKISGAFPMSHLYVQSTETGARGMKGYIPDIYVVPEGLPNGYTLENDPDNPTFDWAVFGDLAVPWNGTQPRVS